MVSWRDLRVDVCHRLVVVVMLALGMILLAMATFAAMAGFIALCDRVQVDR